MHTIGVFACVFDEKGQVLCVRENYGERLWAMPDGRLEAGEDPVSAVEREALEEAATTIRVRTSAGVDAATHRDDLLLLFTADLVERDTRLPDDKLSEIGLFAIDALSDPTGENTRFAFETLSAGSSAF